MDFVNNLTFFVLFFSLALSQMETEEEPPEWPPCSLSMPRGRWLALLLTVVLGAHWTYLVYFPTLARSQHETAQLLVTDNQVDEALWSYQHARKNDPLNSTYAEHLALTQMRLGMSTSALQNAKAGLHYWCIKLLAYRSIEPFVVRCMIQNCWRRHFNTQFLYEWIMLE